MIERSCLLVSDFNIENLASALRNDAEWPALEPVSASFGDVMGTLLDPDASVWSEKYGFVLVWTRPEAVLGSFEAVLGHQRPPLDRILEEVDRFADALERAAVRSPLLLVASWIAPPGHRGLGLIDWQAGGVARSLSEANRHLASRLDAVPNAYLLDAGRWTGHVGEAASNPKLWFMAKVPFTPPVFRLAVEDVKAALRAVSGRARKLIVVDLDDTLWGGLVGEVGGEGLRIGGHDAIGESFVDFQRALRALRDRGVLLAIASKNEESVALAALRDHPEMVLRPEDFSAWRIDWNDKAANVADIVSELNLGLDSAVFIDDNPAERARVREALPDVFVPEWPSDKMLYARALRSLRCFDTPQLSEEDLRRTELYASERRRAQERVSFGSVDDWLRSLDLVMEIDTTEHANRKRCVQLLNKTNQMNLSTRRMTESEFDQWLTAGKRRAWCFRVRDRFGDAGITGLASAEFADGVVRIVDFVLSCRVFGRKLENAMLHVIVDFARGLGAESVEARFLPTEKNKVCLDFWRGSGFEVEADDVFCWDTSRAYPLPEFVTLEPARVP